MSDIPSDLIFKILCRVPAEYLLLYRGVCKSWRRIIDDPVFIKLHTLSLKSHQTLGQLLIRNHDGGRLSSVSLDSLNFDLPDQKIVATHVKNIIRLGVPRLRTLPVPSCNGLILISSTLTDKSISVLWNPLTQESYVLPLPQSDPKFRLVGCVLGYDCVDDDYKVVQIYYEFRKNRSKTLIFSLKSKTWKLIKNCPSSSILIYGVYLNGSLYWISSECIVALDIRTGDFSELPLPPISFPEGINKTLDVFDGCLVLTCIYWGSRVGLDGWVINDNDDDGNISWTRLFSYSKFDKKGCGMPTLKTYSKKDRHVLIQCDDNFFWLDIDSNSAKRIQIESLGASFQHWVPSLCRLNDTTVVVAKSVIGAKRKRAKKREELNITIAEVVDTPDLDS